ncbi:hypothetical protein [Effusibacillus lacus]|uniref:Uncharacterized protein n=1 Tax=Effusibacillus lacus TaxID=1348429 RepID=A0A292YIJ5_9BACL|nr:hypothetical protein [Effusibacillus lacus]TCS75470.1 hypothetical protein EDD64_10725 [Effusibacillus lacus]GAX88936.1 hypothetical protein EFBL_0550 [Effusibacillus lacus]
MKFSTIVKMGGHTFNLLQNKDLLEIYGMASKGLKTYMEKQKQQQPTAQYIPVYIPPQYPAPIDSAYWNRMGYGPYPGSPRMPVPPLYPVPARTQTRQGTKK